MVLCTFCILLQPQCVLRRVCIVLAKSLALIIAGVYKILNAHSVGWGILIDIFWYLFSIYSYFAWLVNFAWWPLPLPPKRFLLQAHVTLDRQTDEVWVADFAVNIWFCVLYSTYFLFALSLSLFRNASMLAPDRKARVERSDEDMHKCTGSGSCFSYAGNCWANYILKAASPACRSKSCFIWSPLPVAYGSQQHKCARAWSSSIGSAVVPSTGTLAAYEANCSARILHSLGGYVLASAVFQDLPVASRPPSVMVGRHRAS